MLKKRIEILEDAHMISKEVSDYTKKIIDYLEIRFDFNVSKLEMFTTHLAMSTQRIVNNEPVNILEADILQQVKENQYYNDATRMYDEIIIDAPVTYPESEKDFIIMHLCNLLQVE